MLSSCLAIVIFKLEYDIATGLIGSRNISKTSLNICICWYIIAYNYGIKLHFLCSFDQEFRAKIIQILWTKKNVEIFNSVSTFIDSDTICEMFLVDKINLSKFEDKSINYVNSSNFNNWYKHVEFMTSDLYKGISLSFYFISILFHLPPFVILLIAKLLFP